MVFGLTWMLMMMMQGCRSCTESERRGLFDLKDYLLSFSDDLQPDILRGWRKTSNRSCCAWRRIKCDLNNKRVTGLSLGFLYPLGYNSDYPPLMNLTLLYPFEELQSLNLSLSSLGGLFDERQGYKSLARFRHLEIMDLSYNFFNSSVFPFLNEAPSLKKLILGGNFIKSGFPVNELVNLRSLEVLDLKLNNISGHLPGKELTNLQKLKALDLSENQFSGSLQMQGICRLEQLQELRLSKNRFVGEFPLCLSSFSKLRVLDLSSNHLSGKLPSFISNLKSMEYLSLHDNNFEGLFSLDLIAKLTELKVFKLSSRSSMLKVVETNGSTGLKSQLRSLTLANCNLGKVPGFLWYQKEMRVLDLSSNTLSGVFPTWLLENNTELQVLLLQNNSFNTLTLPRLHMLQFLDLSANNLNDQLPKDVGLILPWLRHLNLSNNEFHGNMPSSVARMEDIEFMDLSYNNFSGKLPRNLFTGCYSLKWLKISHNRFSGPIIRKSSEETSLMTLIMDSNMFTGKITDNLRSLRLLTVIDLSNNFLTGTIPRWLGNFFLDVLRISNNRLQGEIPPSLFNMPYLWLLDLSGNFLSGNLPRRSDSEYGYILDLHSNNLTGTIPDTLWKGMVLLDLRNNRLSGNIPRFRSTPSIDVILLRGNNLTGKIPDELCGLSNVRMLDFAHNRLNESIPSCLTNLSFGLGGDGHADPAWYPPNMFSYEMDIYTEAYYESVLVSDRFALDYSVDFKVQVEFAVKQRYDSYMRGTLDQMFGLDLSSNELSGEIPEELGDLKRVRSLNLSRNSLSGFIPGSFSKLKSIESLDLSFNKLHGTIPSQLTMLQSLVVFNVSYNNLSGVIPQGKQFNTFSEKSYLGNLLLCGSPTNRSCGTTMSSGQEEEEEEEEEDVEEDERLETVVLWWSVGATYVTILMGFSVFMCFDSPWRRAWFRLVDAFIDRLKDVLGVI
ncbi:receptor-like protein 9DC3 isoform X1 [Eutrema salsugineum]|nr:receptor-like protein 9DC3 isoform X1 [Eutrema salsugineum]